ncbi:MAG: UPF0236 family protein, partial [Anaerolineales bacterium]
MTTVETTVNIIINPEEQSLEELEAQIGQALQRAGQQLLTQACQQMEDQLLQTRADLRRTKRRGLHLLTRFGWVRLERWQVSNTESRYRYALDSLLELEPRQHASPWIIKQSVALATRLPYR